MAYQLNTPGSPPSNIVCAPTDTVTWTTPDNWVGNATQLCSAASGTCGNYADANLVPGVGTYEPAQFGYLPFNLANNLKTLQVGYNISDPGSETFLYKNCIHKTGPTWSGAATSSSDGIPLTLTTAGGSVSATIWNSGDSNGLSTPAYGGFPCPTGTFTLVLDDTNAAFSLAPMTPTFTGSPTGIVTTGATDGGTLVGNTQTNKWWQWTVGQIPVVPAFTGTLTSGQATVTGIANTSALVVGQYVTASGVPVNTKIQTINSSSEITLTANATANGSVSIIAGFQYNLALTLTLTAPTGSTQQTAQNIRMYFNADDFNSSSILPATDLSVSNTVMGGTANNTLGMLLSPGGNYPATVRRLIGSDGCSQETIPSDLTPASAFSWQAPTPVASTVWPTATPSLSGPRILPVYAVQQYNLTNTPKVFFADHYTNSSGAFMAVADSTYPLYPYAVEPASVGTPALGYDWLFPASEWAATKNCVIQVVIADDAGNPIPHNFQSGQQVTFSAGFAPFNVTNSGGSASLSLAGVQSVVFVTSSNTFIFVAGASGLTLEVGMGQVASTQIALPYFTGTTTSGSASVSGITSTANLVVGMPLSGTGIRSGATIASITNSTTIVMSSTATANGTVTITTGNQATVTGQELAPVEVYGQMSAAAPSIGTYVQLNHSMTLTTVTEVATRMRAVIPIGTKVYIQCSNEIFFGNFQNLFNVGLGQLGGWGTNDRNSWMQRGSEMQLCFTNVWGSDAGSLVRLWHPETIDPGDTTLGMTYANENSIPIDMIMLAPYLDMDTSPSFTMAAAQIYANDTDSIAYSGSRWLRPNPGKFY